MHGTAAVHSSHRLTLMDIFRTSFSTFHTTTCFSSGHDTTAAADIHIWDLGSSTSSGGDTGVRGNAGVGPV